MLGLARHPSISTSIPLMTPARRESSSSDIFFWLRSSFMRAETASFILAASVSVVILTLLVIGHYHVINQSLQDYPMPAVSPSISPEIYRIAPGFRALSICVKAAPVADERVGEVALREACE